MPEDSPLPPGINLETILRLLEIPLDTLFVPDITRVHSRFLSEYQRFLFQQNHFRRYNTPRGCTKLWFQYQCNHLQLKHMILPPLLNLYFPHEIQNLIIKSVIE